MLLKFIVALLASVSGVLAATPPGFEPGSQTSLIVAYGNVSALDGTVVGKEISQAVPTIGTLSKLDGTSFAVLMIDLDVPTDKPPKTNPLLHWMQTGLKQSSSATRLNTTTGLIDAFMFSLPNDVDAFAPYYAPNPPAKIPLSHRYTEIIVDTSNATDHDLANLKEAAATRLGFNAQSVLASSRLGDKVAAGNFFNVTNPGPVISTPTSNSTRGDDAASTSVSTPSPSLHTIGAALSQRESPMAIVMIGIALFIL
ncbi:PEBP-like protein [Xylaria nigripes]|nr:PEBP-like protein [Xylaria nigripes]